VRLTATSASSLLEPALSQIISELIVGEGMAAQEAAQGLGVSWVAQPDEGLDVKLARSFGADSQSGSDLTVDSRRPSVEAIPGDDDHPQPLRQALHQVVNCLPYDRLFPGHGGVMCLDGQKSIAGHRK